MRKGISKDENGVRTFNLQKIIGKGFGNGWFTHCHCRYRIFEGARNTGKSKRMIGYESICKILSDPKRNIVVARQDDVNNRQSTYANIVRCINDLGLQEFFKTKEQPLQIKYLPTGQMILFRGLNNPMSWTSLEFETGYLTDIYIEEAFEVPSFDSFEMIDGSVRAGQDFDEQGNLVKAEIPLQITLLLNPWSENWIYQEFFRGRLEDDYEYLLTHKYMEYKDENYQGNHGKGLYLHKSTYKVNEFRDKNEVDAAAENMRLKNPDLYKVVYLGMWGATGQVTYPEFVPERNTKDLTSLLNIPIVGYTLGIDAGFSNGEGKKRKVRKGEDPAARVRAATTMSLVGFSTGYNQLIMYKEYYHTNIASRAYLNTDNDKEMTMPELAGAIVREIIKWKDEFNNMRFSSVAARNSANRLLKGTITAYVDNADIGFIQTLELKAREFGLNNINFVPSTKKPINGRVLFEKALLSYGDLLIESSCKNMIRETKNARGDEDGNIRSDEDDHMLTAFEYAYAPYRDEFVAWKTNFKDQ